METPTIERRIFLITDERHKWTNHDILRLKYGSRWL